jgi:hypothetical protein
MSINMAGSAQSVQQSLNLVRQNISVDQVAAAAAVEASHQASKIAVQETPEVTPADENRGHNLDVRA